MDTQLLPGTFILEAAEHGLKAASALSGFSASTKCKEWAAKVSLSASLLSEIGKQVNLSAACFKENFQKTFEHVTKKCEEQYLKILKALETASSFDKRDTVEETTDRPQKPFNRFLEALDMDKLQFLQFQESLDECWLHGLMLQQIVSLIVLQIRAQKQEPLTLSEYNKLGQLKKGLGKLLKTIREQEIASVVTFSLVDLTKPANASQLVAAAEFLAQQESSSRDDASITSSSATVLNSPVEEPTSPKHIEKPQSPPPPPPASVYYEDEYEMYRVSVNTHEKERAHTRFRLFGIPGLFNLGRIKTETTTHVDKIPSSVPEIKAFMLKEKDDEYTIPPTVNDLINVSPKISTAIYALVNERTRTPQYPRRNWNTEFLVNWEWWESKFCGRKQKKTAGYIVILRGRNAMAYLGPPPPPPQAGWPGAPPVVVNLTTHPKLSTSGRDITADVELTQQETEKVINDFLATFSALYDDISVEKRGAALRGIDLKEVDKLCDYDSDDSDDSDDSSSSGSGSSRSLVDD